MTSDSKVIAVFNEVYESLVFFSHKIWSKNMKNNNASFSENCSINDGINERNFYTRYVPAAYIREEE